MYLISINFDENKVPDHYFKNIYNNKCTVYSIDDEFLIVTDTQGVLHYYKKDYIIAFHVEYLGFAEVHNEE